MHMTLERWRHLTEWPLTAAAAVFLVDMRAATRGQIRELSKQVTELKALLEQRSA